MNKTKLKNISKSINSGLTPLRSNLIFWNDGNIPWLKTEQLGIKYIYDTHEKITKEALDATSIKINPINTISIAMYGEGKTRGNVSILKKEMATNQACCNVVLDEEKANHEFVYYLLKTKYEKLRSLSSGVRKNLNSDDIKNLEIELPEKLEDQYEIASVLSTLDAKIEINNKINAKLEAIAKTLYDYWFIQFDFPDDNGKPYKFSGGEMVWSEELKREIPRGWKVTKLNQLLSNKTETIASSVLKPDDSYTPIDFLPMKKMSFGTYLPPSEARTSLIRYNSKDILIGAMRVYFHRVCIAPFDGITRTTTLVLSPNEPKQLGYLYQVCNEKRTIAVASSLSVGTQQPYVTWENGLENYQIPYPKDMNLTLKYSRIVGPLISNVISNKIENQKLAELRDWLLPMLMNGQVKVEEEISNSVKTYDPEALPVSQLVN